MPKVHPPLWRVAVCRSLLLPMIAEKMEAVKTLIRDVARTKCREQSSKYKARIAKLSQRPMNLKVSGPTQSGRL